MAENSIDPKTEETSEKPQEAADASATSEQVEASETTQAEPSPTTGMSDFLSHRDAMATGETYTPSPEELKARNKRSLAIAGGLVVFIVLVFVISILKISALSNGAG